MYIFPLFILIVIHTIQHLSFFAQPSQGEFFQIFFYFHDAFAFLFGVYMYLNEFSLLVVYVQFVYIDVIFGA